MNDDEKPLESNVQSLIDQLQQEGVDAGRAEAARIVDEATRRAQRIEQQAREEADKLVERAHREADALHNAGLQALQQAFRDTVLRVKNDLVESLAHQLRETIKYRLQDRDLLDQLLLEIAGKHRLADDENATVLLPDTVLGVDELRQQPDKLTQGHLLELMSDQLRESLRSGVTLAVDKSQRAGLSIRAHDGEVSVVLDEDAAARLLMQHLRPRFRALLEGVVS